MTYPLIFNSHWTNLEKILFRFVFILFGLFIIIENNGAYPFWQWFMYYPTEFLHQVIPWIGKHVLHLSYDITVFTNGSGDTTYDYIIVLTIFCISLIGTGLWSVFDRNRKSYSLLYYWLAVAVRFYIGLMLINYGLIKVIKIQFPFPDMHRLTQTYGDSSPMGLAWTFLGFSQGYNLFMGIAEIAAVLLLFRRTVTIGAIITLMTTVNVMAVNYFYDVPVKIISTGLVVMTLFLLLRDAKALFGLFFKGEMIQLNEIQSPIAGNMKLRIGMLASKLILIGSVFFGGITFAITHATQYAHVESRPQPPLSGVYQVNSFSIRKNDLFLKVRDSARWKALAIGEMGFVNIKYADDSTRNFRIKADTALRTFELTKTKDYRTTDYFHYDRRDQTHFVLQGKIGTDSVVIQLTMNKDRREDFLLTQRGFHWINEYPFNK